MSKIEQVARALDQSLWAAMDGGTVMPITRQISLDAAERAIEAMRPASDAMMVAGGLKCKALMFEGEGSGNIIKDMGTVFDAMIDAALSEVKG